MEERVEDRDLLLKTQGETSDAAVHDRTRKKYKYKHKYKRKYKRTSKQ